MEKEKVRKIDGLGRIIIPIELRKNLNINENDEIKIYMQDKKIILEKKWSSEKVNAIL